MPRRKTSVLILHNEPKPSGREGTFAESEAGVLVEVQAVSEALHKQNVRHRAVGVRRFEDLPAILAASDEPVVFNLVQGFWSDTGQENLVPAVIAGFGKAFTGNDAQALLLTLDKWECKTLLAAAGLPTPKGMIVRSGQRISAKDLCEGPYIVKPVRTDASEGIDKTSIILKRGKALQEAVGRIHDRMAQPALIEPYIEGRELNISVICRKGDLEVLPLAEIDFSAFEEGRPRIVGYEAKWLADSFEFHHTPRIIPAPLPKRLTEQIRELAVAACRALRCFEYCRVDFRLDHANRPYVLEVNANPDISPDAGFAAALEAGVISYKAFGKSVIDNALRRRSQCRVRTTQPNRVYSMKLVRGTHPTIDIRWCRPEDRQVVLSFLADTGFFRPDEIDIAREVLDSALAEGPTGHYQSFVAVADGETVGWICYGPTPCTIGTYDIYWIGVSPAWQGKGVGRALTAFAEQAIRERGGRLFVVETSGRESYHSTHQFYQRLGYREAAVIPDFYGPGDPRVIFIKAATISHDSPPRPGQRILRSQ